MSDLAVYPASPNDVPGDLTQAKSSYKNQAWLAMIGLTAFMLFYLSLAACFAWIVYKNILLIEAGQAGLVQFLVGGIALLLTIFMVKSLFSVRRAGEPAGIEITAEDEPVLFKFLHNLSDEVGAPKPHRVFLTSEVNAAVFYDLSLLNLIFPSRKNLIIGLGLVNTLNLGELKAVLAHEFGHFAQGSMAVGRWVYVAQQVIAHMVATRDWLDKLVRFVSRIDLRIAWVGWILALVIWSIRSLMDTLFRLVILAERALSREMEFNADLVAVSVTGSDALVNALYKLQTADNAWQTALDVASSQANKGKRIEDIFAAQLDAMKAIGRTLNESEYGQVPENDGKPEQRRIFSEMTARPPQMWSTHPANRDREDNAKSTYIAAEVDNRDAWLIFAKPDSLRQQVSSNFYKADKRDELEVVSAEEAVNFRFGRAIYSPEYRGTYLNRSPVRNFSSVKEIVDSSDLTSINPDVFSTLYPESLADQLRAARNLDLEKRTLEELESGALKPSGGVIRHRGKELKKAEIPDAIDEVASERREVARQLKTHDANCRKAHLALAKKVGQGWEEYLIGLIRLLHCTEHVEAVVGNERALLVNTWQVITADGKIGYFEKRRIVKTATQVQNKVRQLSAIMREIQIPQSVSDVVGIKNWDEQCPNFDLPDVSDKNWHDWCIAAFKRLDHCQFVLGLIRSATLEELISTEAMLRSHLLEKSELVQAPMSGTCPTEYPVLMPGDEHMLQRKLDLWNRFQLAHGFAPTALRLIVSLGIVGGTIYTGLMAVVAS